MSLVVANVRKDLAKKTGFMTYASKCVFFSLSFLLLWMSLSNALLVQKLSKFPHAFRSSSSSSSSYDRYRLVQNWFFRFWVSLDDNGFGKMNWIHLKDFSHVWKWIINYIRPCHTWKRKMLNRKDSFNSAKKEKILTFVRRGKKKKRKEISFKNM